MQPRVSRGCFFYISPLATPAMTRIIFFALGPLLSLGLLAPSFASPLPLPPLVLPLPVSQNVIPAKKPLIAEKSNGLVCEKRIHKVPEAHHFTGEGANRVLEVGDVSPCNTAIYSSALWVSATINKRGTLSITVEPNPTESIRESLVSLAIGGQARRITIHQQGQPVLPATTPELINESH